VVGNDVTGVTSTGAGILVNSTTGQTGRTVLVDGNTISNCKQYGININNNGGTLSGVVVGINDIYNCGTTATTGTSAGIQLAANNVTVFASMLDTCGLRTGSQDSAAVPATRLIRSRWQ
jgi:hypothetical protein